jgi:serine/threonine protein kinase
MNQSTPDAPNPDDTPLAEPTTPVTHGASLRFSIGDAFPTLERVEIREEDRCEPIRGGQSCIYRGFDTELHRPVAVKCMRDNNIETAQGRFLFEVEVTRELEHPGVVPVYGFGSIPTINGPCFAMRWLGTRTLAKAITDYHQDEGPAGRHAKRVAFRELITRFVAVCHTIAYSHSRGILHRDLKPSNVILGEFGETVVLDWGLAKRIAPQPSREGLSDPFPRIAKDPLTVAGVALGTPDYWAPEQKEGVLDQQTVRTDVYGLGGILFSILTNRTPPSGGYPLDCPPSPSALPDTVIDRIVRKALAADCRRRHQSATALAAEVEAWLADLPVGAIRATVLDLAQSAAEHPADLKLAEQLARQRGHLGLILSGMGRHKEATESFQAATEGFTRLLKSGTPEPQLLAEAAGCHAYFSQALTAADRCEEADVQKERAKELYNRLIVSDTVYGPLIQPLLTNMAGLIPPTSAPVPRASEPRDAQNIHPSGTPNTQGSQPAAPPLRPPLERSHGYRVVMVLGQGNVARVVLAEDQVLSRMVAIKDLLPGQTDEMARRLLLELQITARLDHPNIVRLHTHGTREGTACPFLVLEYIRGKTLGEEITAFHTSGDLRQVEDNPRFTRLLEAFAQACDAVHHAHTKGVIHRDPKPANIMVRKDGTAVLIDWGIAKIVDNEALIPDQTELARFYLSPELAGITAGDLGTPAYRAPEQAAGGKVGRYTDVYILGAGLHEILTGRPPAPTNLNASPTTTARSLDLNKSVQPYLYNICKKAIAIDVHERYQRADELAEEIRAWFAQAPQPLGWLRQLWCAMLRLVQGGPT